ncbi:MAG: site-specific integrase [Chloroflexota bacterium]|nr:site-specific integrase [Chloroflexota bacterium]
MVLIETKQDDVRLPRPIRDADLPALDVAIAKAAQPYRLIFTLLRETGLRADEVLRLNVGDVSLEPSREGLLLREAKNNRERMVVLNPDLMKRSVRLLRSTLRDLGPVDTSMPLFRSNRGTRIPYDTLYYQWQRRCAAADLLDPDGKPRYTIHQLRHTAGTAFIRDYPEHIVSRMLGHRDPRSTRRYAAVTEDQVRAVLAARRRR